MKISQAPVQPPTLDAVANADIDENSAAGSIVVTLAGQTGEGVPVSYELVGGSDLFEILSGENTVKVKRGVTLDFDSLSAGERISTLRVRAVITKAGQTLKSPVQSFTVSVTNLPDEPITVSADTVTPGIDENVAAGHRVATLSSRSAEAGITPEYVLVGTSDYFEVVNEPIQPGQPRAGFVRLKAGVQLDHEALPPDQRVQTIGVQARYAKDGATVSSEELEITVTIRDVDEAPVFDAATLRQSADEITGSAAKTFTVTATDDDGDQVAYGLAPASAANDNGLLSSIDPQTGVVTFRDGAFNHEAARIDASTGERYFLIDVLARSTKAGHAEQATPAQLRITVNDVNDITPVISNLASRSFENAVLINNRIDDYVGLTKNDVTSFLFDADLAYDDDLPGITVTFTLGGSGYDPALFGFDAATGQVWFKTRPAADTRYDLTMVATSSAGGRVLTSEVASFSVTMDPPLPVFDADARRQVADEVHGVNDAQGTRSVTVPNLDAQGNSITFTLAPVADANDNDKVTINGNVVTFNAGVFDHESSEARVDPNTGEHYFLVDVLTSTTSPSGAVTTGSAQLRFVITDINDITPRLLNRGDIPPPSVDVPHNVAFHADKAHARILGDQSAWDPASIDDVAGITVGYKLTGSADDLRFLSIDRTTGEIWFKIQPEPGRRYVMQIVIESEANGHVMTSTPITFRVDVADLDSSGAIPMVPPPSPPVFDPVAHRQVADEVNGLADVPERRSFTVPNVDAQQNRITFTLAASAAGNDNAHVSMSGNVVTFHAGVFDHERAGMRMMRTPASGIS